jgi:hypothetical protein
MKTQPDNVIVLKKRLKKIAKSDLDHVVDDFNELVKWWNKK